MQQQRVDRIEVESGLELNFPQTFAAERSLAARLVIMRDALLSEAQEFVGFMSPLAQTNAPAGSSKNIPLKILDAFTIVLEQDSPPELVTIMLCQDPTRRDQIVPHITPHRRHDLLGDRLAQHLELYLKDNFDAALGRNVIAAECEVRAQRGRSLRSVGMVGLATVVAAGAIYGVWSHAANAPSLENSGLITANGNIELEKLTSQSVILIQGKEIRFEAVVQRIENEPARVARDGTLSLHRYKLISPSSGKVLAVKPIWYGQGLENGARYQINGYVRDNTMPLFMQHVFFEKLR